MGLLDIVPAGVVTGKNLLKVFEYGKYFLYILFFSWIAHNLSFL